jgi:hypothetical protein
VQLWSGYFLLLSSSRTACSLGLEAGHGHGLSWPFLRGPFEGLCFGNQHAVHASTVDASQRTFSCVYFYVYNTSVNFSQTAALCGGGGGGNAVFSGNHTWVTDSTVATAFVPPVAHAESSRRGHARLIAADIAISRLRMSCMPVWQWKPRVPLAEATASSAQ